MGIKTNKSISPMYKTYELVFHIAVGFVLFAVILSPAIGLKMLRNYLVNIGISGPILYSLTIVEYMLVVADLIFMITFLLKEVIRYIRSDLGIRMQPTINDKTKDSG